MLFKIVIYFYNFILPFFFWGGLCWVFLADHSFSLVLVSSGYSLVEVHWFLILVASLIAEHRLQCMWASVVTGPSL